MLENLSRLALVARVSSQLFLGKPLPPSCKALNEALNQIPMLSIFQPAKKVAYNVFPIEEARNRAVSSVEPLSDIVQEDALDEDLVQEDIHRCSAIQAWNTISDDIIMFARGLVVMASSAYPSCWMVRLIILESVLVHYITHRLTIPGRLIVEMSNFLFKRAPADQSVSRKIGQLIEQESLLTFLFLLNICTSVASPEANSENSHTLQKTLIRSAQANSNRDRVVPALLKFVMTHQNQPCTVLGWQAMQSLLNDLPHHLHSDMYVVWNPRPCVHSPQAKDLLRKGILPFAAVGRKNALVSLKQTVVDIIRERNEVNGRNKEQDEIFSPDVPASKPKALPSGVPVQQGVIDLTGNSSISLGNQKDTRVHNEAPNKRPLDASSSSDESSQKRSRAVANGLSHVNSASHPSRPPTHPSYPVSHSSQPALPQSRPSSYSVDPSPLPTPNNLGAQVDLPSFLNAVVPPARHRTLVSQLPPPASSSRPAQFAPSSVPSSSTPPLSEGPSLVMQLLQRRFMNAVCRAPYQYFNGNIYERERLLKCLKEIFAMPKQKLTVDLLSRLASRNNTNADWVRQWKEVMLACLQVDMKYFDRFVLIERSAATGPLTDSQLVVRYEANHGQYEIQHAWLLKCRILHRPLPPLSSEIALFESRPIVPFQSTPATHPLTHGNIQVQAAGFNHSAPVAPTGNPFYANNNPNLNRAIMNHGNPNMCVNPNYAATSAPVAQPDPYHMQHFPFSSNSNASQSSSAPSQWVAHSNQVASSNGSANRNPNYVAIPAPVAQADPTNIQNFPFSSSSNVSQSSGAASQSVTHSDPTSTRPAPNPTCHNVSNVNNVSNVTQLSSSTTNAPLSAGLSSAKTSSSQPPSAAAPSSSHNPNAESAIVNSSTSSAPTSNSTSHSQPQQPPPTEKRWRVIW